MKIKRILATVLAIAMLASFISVPVFAEEAVPTLISTAFGEGYICEDLGILIGPDENGVTEDYLDTLAMRTQAAMVNLRLFGLESEALAFEGTETFADAALATEYWQPILEYLKANPGLGWVGDENGNFLPNDYITGQAFTKILLVALGYEYGLYFDWETTMDFAAEIGMTALAEKADDDLTVRDIAVAIFEALGLKTTGPTDVTLITQLVLDGVIDEAAAVAAGFEVEEPTLVIINAYASAVDEVTVLTSMEIPDGTPISLKKGTAGYVAVEVVDGTTLTLTTLFNLPAGSYTVTVGEETAEFEVMACYATDLVIAANTIYLDNEQDLEVSLLDQYGDPMSLTGTNYSVFNQSDGYVYKPYVTDTMVVDILDDKGDDKDDPGVEAGDSINVFVFDPASMLTASKVLVVEEAPVLTEIIVGGVTPGDDAAKIFEKTEDNVLAVEGIDQYGNPYELTNSLFKSGTLQILLSDEAVIAPMSITFNEGDLEFYANEPGNSLFTFIIPSEAFIATSEMITVYADPEAASIEIAGPVEAVYANETTTMPVTGFDQYGDVIVITGDEDIMFTTTVDLSTEIGISADDTLGFTAALDGTTTVYYFLDGVFQGTFDVTVNEEAYPFQVVGINDVPTALLQGTEFYFDDTNIDVIDQYGRPVSAATISDSAFDVIAWTELDAEHIYADSEPFGANYYIAAPGDSEQGSDPVYIGIYNPDVDDITLESIYSFTAQAVGIEDLATYSLDVIADTLCSNDENWDNYDQIAYYWARLWAQMYIEYDTELPFIGKGEPIIVPWLEEITPYASPLLFKAYLDDGTEVNIMNFGKGGFIMEELLDLITFSIENVTMGMPMFFDNQNDPTAVAFNDAEGTCIIKAWINGEAVAETTVEISKATPVVAGITAEPATLDLTSYGDEYDLLMEEDILTQLIYLEELSEGFRFMFIDDELFDSFTGFIVMAHFKIVDQYGVELPWEALYEMGEINIIVNYVETDDGVDMLVTVMTTDGVYYDTIRVTNIDDIFLSSK